MRFVADFEDVLGVDVAKALKGRLEVVQTLAEIALSGEYHRLHSVVGERNSFRFRHRQQTGEDLVKEGVDGGEEEAMR